jgi:translation initiation factor 2 subunit 3
MSDNIEPEVITELLKQLQPCLTIATFGHAAHGKSTLIKYMTGVDTMKSKKENQEHKTIKLGFTNAKIFKCNRCPKPYCYQFNTETCKNCFDPTELVLHISFVDSPGHSDLQTTAMSGASTVDYSLLLMAANHKDAKDNDKNNKESIVEHYKIINILGLNDRTIGIQNKIDLVPKIKAFEHFEEIKRNYKLRCVIPICASYGFGVEYLVQYLVETIPSPINDEYLNKIRQPLRASIIRSFDINKKGTDTSDMKGAVIGGTIKTGKIRVGDRIKLVPGIITQNSKNYPIEAIVTSLKTDNTNLNIAFPGGLIGIGLSIDPSLSRNDVLVGNFVVEPDNTTCRIFKSCTISYEEYDKSDFKVKVNSICTMMLGSIKRVIKIMKMDTNKKQITFICQVNMAGEIDDSVIVILDKNGPIQLYGKIIQIHE